MMTFKKIGAFGITIHCVAAGAAADFSPCGDSDPDAIVSDDIKDVNCKACLEEVGYEEKPKRKRRKKNEDPSGSNA
jgi:hypothetical protein